MTPEEEEDVRRALAATARHEDPASTPPEVVARLDRVLADLVGPRVEERAVLPSASHDPLATARRRRLHPLVAAAAVVVIALAGTAVATRGFGGGSSSSSASSSSDSEKSASHRKDPPPAAGASGSTGGSGRGLPRLHSATLARDVARVIAGRPVLRAAVAAACERPLASVGRLRRAVRLDGRTATLVIGPRRGGVRVARVYACHDAAAPIATTRVPRG